VLDHLADHSRIFDARARRDDARIGGIELSKVHVDRMNRRGEPFEEGRDEMRPEEAACAEDRDSPWGHPEPAASGMKMSGHRSFPEWYVRRTALSAGEPTSHR
jgi:hypothetical protein